MPERFVEAARLIEAAQDAGAFPAAVIEVGDPTRPRWRRAFGRLTYDSDAPAATDETIFDLASLTKVIATATLAMRAVERGRLRLDDRVAELLTTWRGEDRAAVTIRDLLEHASGLTAYLPFFRDHQGRTEYEAAIGTLPLEYVPRRQSIYSDLGFILLGFILEDAMEQPLGGQFAAIEAAVAPAPLRFRPPREWRARAAPTEVDTWRGRLLAGEVHDENAWALGGAAGHAGLFGTAGASGAFARLALRGLLGEPTLASPDAWRRFAALSAVPGSSRALGWDTMRPTSSCGARMSASAIGHTGFTGTSLWIDPARRAYVVLLTNRVHPSRDNEALQALRPKVHDAVMDAIVNSEW